VDIFSITHREAIISAFGNHYLYIYCYLWTYSISSCIS